MFLNMIWSYDEQDSYASFHFLLLQRKTHVYLSVHRYFTPNLCLPICHFFHKIWKSGFSTYSLNFYSIIHATYHWNFCVWISDGNIHEKGVMAKFLYFNWNKLSKEAALKLQSMKSYLSVFFFCNHMIHHITSFLLLKFNVSKFFCT